MNIKTKTMAWESTLSQYIKSKIICLFIGHRWCHTRKIEGLHYKITACCRCCDTRIRPY